jgi:hypothetical protein
MLVFSVWRDVLNCSQKAYLRDRSREKGQKSDILGRANKGFADLAKQRNNLVAILRCISDWLEDAAA